MVISGHQVPSPPNKLTSPSVPNNNGRKEKKTRGTSMVGGRGAFGMWVNEGENEDSKTEIKLDGDQQSDGTKIRTALMSYFGKVRTNRAIGELFPPKIKRNSKNGNCSFNKDGNVGRGEIYSTGKLKQSNTKEGYNDMVKNQSSVSSFKKRMARKVSSTYRTRKSSFTAMLDLDYITESEDYHDNNNNERFHIFDKQKEQEEEKTKNPHGFLQRTFLRPQFSLRNQLLLSYGIVSIFALIFVMTAAIIGAVSAGDRLKTETRMELTKSTESNLSATTRCVAEALTKIFLDSSPIHLLLEATKDRFVGYPNHEGYADDSNVPFFDILSGRNAYPLNESSLPLDWEFEPNVNDKNYHEHVQDRWDWYKKEENAEISTASAVYYMQGQCDPSEKSEYSNRYYPNCTQGNNDLSTGGVLRPTPTNKLLAEKAGDLNFVLKALYEFHQNVKLIGVYFANSGAGSATKFPAKRADNSKTYVSIGCEWMSAPNPLDPSKPIASREEISRCHPKGEIVSGREYNPLERAWCREQALDPENIKHFGPYRDAFDSSWVVSSGKAVYDRLTNEFIACTLADLRIGTISKILSTLKLEQMDTSETMMVRWDGNGTVVAAAGWNHTKNIFPTIKIKDTGLGIDQTTFDDLTSLVDFSRVWDPTEARIAFETVLTREDKLLSAFPLPAIPDSYDNKYRPEFIVITTWDQKKSLGIIDETDKNVDNTIVGLIQFILVVTFVGLGIILFMTYAVSCQLTRPLKWMHWVGDQIINKLGQGLEKRLDISEAPKTRWSPTTEITDLVREFQKMVSNFSGKGIAKVTKKDLTEIKNPFCLFAEFESLYLSRQESAYEYSYRDVPSHISSSNDTDVNGAFVQNESQHSSNFGHLHHHQHFGRNLCDNDEDTKLSSLSNFEGRKKLSQILRSPLFWWISGSIIIPLLFTFVIISVVVTCRVSYELPDIVTDVENVFMELKANSLELTAKLHAKDETQTLFMALRDLHILSRVANWLLLGGIKRSNSFTRMGSRVEECKVSPLESCAFLEDPLKAVCDCKWLTEPSSSNAKKCHNYDLDTRYLQEQSYFIQSNNHWPNGDRNYSTYPNTSYSPETTAWWSNISDLPGSYKQNSASGYETTYDRLRVMSALSVVQIPLFNSHVSLKERNDNVASHIGFEADGMTISYMGCKYPSAYLAHWNSTKSNRAFEIRPELCPEGKYGYDPRCREWYDMGKQTWETSDDKLYVTKPYLFADGNSVAQSATMPLEASNSNSRDSGNDNKYIGQALIDFFPRNIVHLLRSSSEFDTDMFPFLVTGKQNDGLPSSSGGYYKSDIADLVLPHDCKVESDDDNVYCKYNKNRQHFDDIIEKMKCGESGKAVFNRTNEKGIEETLNVAHAPIYGMSFAPLNSSDFARGTSKHESLIFALAFAERHQSLYRAFGDLKNALRKRVNSSLVVLVIVMSLACIFVLVISSHVTVSMTIPIAHLLTVMKNINRSQVKDDMPEIYRGSKEVSCVHSTFEKLYTVLRFSSSAYFSGDLSKAYEVLVDALALFQKMKNKKAVGVANNNLGNTMLIMYQTMQCQKSDVICGMPDKEIIAKGLAYFDSAINAGEEAIERINHETGFSLEYLVFMQQLSNRYFNRAMFLLTICDNVNSPVDAEQLGLSDLMIARDMDVEFIDQSNQEGFEFDEEVRFNLVLGRIRGLLLLRDMSFKFDWNVEELFEDAIEALRDAMKNPEKMSFRELGPVGQMQQLDAALIEYLMQERDDIHGAARVGIRMLVEDEYVFVDAALAAVDPLIRYAEKSSFKSKESPKEILETLAEYKSSLCHLDFSQCGVGRFGSRAGYVTMEHF